MARNTVNILDVNIDSTPKMGVLRYVRSNLQKWDERKDLGTGIFIVTPNPEQVVLATKDSKFKDILNSSFVSVPDGFGITMAHEFNNLSSTRIGLLKFPLYFFQGCYVGVKNILDKKSSKLKVIKGREFFVDLIKIANKKSWRVYLLGGVDGTVQEVVEVLKRSNKKIRFKNASGPVLGDDGTPVSNEEKSLEKEIIKDINTFRPHFLFVAFGAPKQEKWVYRWLPKMHVGCAMVVGGTFDYVSGRAKIPPKKIRDLGLEWSWRLINEPKRAKRIINAVFVFPYLVFKEKLLSS